MTSSNEASDPIAVQRRTRRLFSGFLPFTRLFSHAFVVAILSTGAGIVVGKLSGDVWLAGAASLALVVVAIAAVWAPIARPTFRAAAEIFFDHYRHERAEWKAEVGSNPPRGIPAARSWLVQHPTGPGRATVLLVVGELEQADRAIALMQPRTPEEAFGVEILRQTRVLLAGQTPDLSSLHATWRALPDPIERRHRRECLALLDAQTAVDRGEDPMPVLAAARAEIPAPIDRFVLARMATGLVALVTLTVSTAVLVSSALINRAG